MIVDHQAHWYPRSCVEALVGRSDYPKVERGADGGYVFLADDGIAQPAMGALTAGEAAEMFDRIHQEYAIAQRAYPSRIPGSSAAPDFPPTWNPGAR